MTTVGSKCWGGLEISLSEVSIKTCHSLGSEGSKGRVSVKVEVKVQNQFACIRRRRYLLREDDTRRPYLCSSM